MSCDILVRNRISPIQMKSGSAVRAQFQLASHMVEARSEPAGAGVNRTRVTMLATVRQTATQTPLPRKNKTTASSTSEATTT
jgi:hypothetical protein